MISVLFIRRKGLMMLCKRKKFDWFAHWLSNGRIDDPIVKRMVAFSNSIRLLSQSGIPLPGIEMFLYWCWFFIQLYHRFIRYRSFPTSLGSRTNQSPWFCQPASILIPHSNPGFLSFSHVYTTLTRETSALYLCIFLVWNQEKQFDRYCAYDCSKNIDMLIIVLCVIN